MIKMTAISKVLMPSIAAFTLAYSAPASAAIVSGYNSLTDWTTAAGTPVTVEDFSDANLVSGFSVSGGLISGSVFSGQAMPGVFPTSSRNTFSFSPGTRAFGADWDLSPGGPGAGIGFTLTFSNGTTQDFFGFSNPATGGTFNGFFGLVSDTEFSSISLYTGSFTGNSELFDMDNARFVGKQENPVPEPASLVLVGVALAGVAFSRRNKG